MLGHESRYFAGPTRRTRQALASATLVATTPHQHDVLLDELAYFASAPGIHGVAASTAMQLENFGGLTVYGLDGGVSNKGYCVDGDVLTQLNTTGVIINNLLYRRAG